MFGVWNTIIKTPFVHFNTVFTIKADGDNKIKIGMDAEPFFRKLSFQNIRIDAHVLKATGIDPEGNSQELELLFNGETFTGSLTFPYFGTVAFSGNKGRGETLANRLKRYGSKSVQDNRIWKGSWIWDAEQPESVGRLEHRLVYFRRSFHVSEGTHPTLKIDITADSRYRLFVNGRSVAVGPCKGDAHTHYYETVDVSPYLVPGENILAVKVLRYPASEPFKLGDGGPVSVWRTQSAGLLVEASLRDENDDSELESLHSGLEWRTFRHRGYRHISKYLIRWMGGVEEVDGSGAPQGWEYPGFNDADWVPAIPFSRPSAEVGILKPWNLTPRPIPFLYEEERTFVKATKIEGIEMKQVDLLLQKAPGRQPLTLPAGSKMAVELDAGELMTGYLKVGFRGGRGSKIRLLCSEGYEAQDSSVMRRIKGNREDASGGKLIGEYDVYSVAGHGNERSEEVYEPFLFRTFRYMRLEIETGEKPLELLYAGYRETGYPLEVKAQFRCSDEDLNTIWDMSIRTLKRCMHETYEDCPYYEQLQYTMDSRLMMLFTYYISADDRMPRRTIADFYRSRQPSGLLQSRFPSVEPQIIPSFALYWVDMLAEHYEFNGDTQLIAQYRPAMIELMDWYRERMTDEGIIGVTSNRYWTYFDWVDAWPLGAPPESIDRPMYLLSLMVAASLRKAGKLLVVTGWNDAAAEMEATADRLCQSVRRLAWSEERQLFRDLPETEIYSQHTQIMAVLSGAVVGAEAKELLVRTLREPMHRVTLPFSYLLFQALKMTGLQHEAFELWDRWRGFASQGLTTLPETEVNPRSDCHAWSAVPLAEFPASILGVTPAEPGFTAVMIEPQPGKLTWAKGSVATAQGMVEVEWRLDGNLFTLKAKLPDSVSARVKLPDGTEKMIQGEAELQSAI